MGCPLTNMLTPCKENLAHPYKKFSENNDYLSTVNRVRGHYSGECGKQKHEDNIQPPLVNCLRVMFNFDDYRGSIIRHLQQREHLQSRQ